MEGITPKKAREKQIEWILEWDWDEMGCVSSRTQISHGPLSFRAYFRDLLYNCCASSLHYHDTLPFFLLSYRHSLDSVWFYFFPGYRESRNDGRKQRPRCDRWCCESSAFGKACLFSYFDLHCQLITNPFKKSFVLLTPCVKNKSGPLASYSHVKLSRPIKLTL